MKSFSEKFQELFRTKPDKICLRDQVGTCITYKELDTITGKIYSFLKNKGIGCGDFVFINMPRSAMVYAITIGIIRSGAAFVVLEASSPVQRADFIRKDCRSCITINSGNWMEIMSQQPAEGWAEVQDSDPMCAIYTSGTTGTPKGAVHQMGMLRRNVEAFNYRGAELATKGLAFAAIFPLNFVALEISTVFLYQGGSIDVLDYTTIRTPELLYNYFHKNSIESVFITPALYKTFKKINPSLKQIFVGGEVATDLEKIQIPVYNFYGMGEMGHLLCVHKIDGSKGTVPIGTPTIKDSVFIIGENGEKAQDGKPGEICINNPFAAGYINLPKLNKEKFINGVFHTGDLGTVLPDGNILHQGRMDSMIKIHGNRVEPAEIKSVLEELQDQEWCAVKGFEKEKTTYICAYYTSLKEFDANQLRQELENRLPEYMIPAFFIHLDKVPLTPNGKVNTKELPEPDFAQYRAPYAAPVSQLEKILCRSLGRALEIEPFGLDDDFVKLGADSIAIAEAVSECNLTGINFQEVYDLHTPRELVKFYQGRQNRQ